MTRTEAEKAVRRQRERGEWALRNNLRSRFGITLEDYEALREGQEHRCALCGRHEDELPRSRTGRPPKDGGDPTPALVLGVDCYHGTKDVRSLLCHGCNAAMTLMRDDPVRLLAAASYLRGSGLPDADKTLL